MTDHRDGIDDCWNRIGVWSTARPRCERLDEFVHCWRCPVYAAAAIRLRDRPPPPDYLESGRLHFAEPLASRAHARDEAAILIFRLFTERFALPLNSVDEVIEPAPVHRLGGCLFGPVRGLAVVHGRLRPYTDLTGLLELDSPADREQARRGRYPRMIVVRRQRFRAVFSVDEVLAVERSIIAQPKALPTTVSHAMKRFTRGLISAGNLELGLLDAELLLDVLTGKVQA